MQGAKAIRPVLRQRLSAPADDVVAGAAGVGRAHFEASGEDQAVEFVFLAIRHHAVLRQALDALAVGIHQGDVRAIVGGQVFVVEARPLAELPVPGLERRRRDRVFDDGVHTGAHLVHLLVVGQHHQFGAFLAGEAPAQPA